MSNNDSEASLHSTLRTLLSNLTQIETQFERYGLYLESQSAHRAHAAKVAEALKSGRDATQLIDSGIEPSIVSSQKP